VVSIIRTGSNWYWSTKPTDMRNGSSKGSSRVTEFHFRFFEVLVVLLPTLRVFSVVKVRMPFFTRGATKPVSEHLSGSTDISR